MKRLMLVLESKQTARLVSVLALLSGLAVFCVVQDRVTAAGARRYVAMQRQKRPVHRVGVLARDAPGRVLRAGRLRFRALQ